tara:strand:+ start:619 stop:972 length:354 start_codon:yes stop_codon:yes gene_type:complete
MVILQKKISRKHNDSTWYDGLIAYNGQYSLYAQGEICFIKRNKNGDYQGMYDGKTRDDFPEIKNDKDLSSIFNENNGFSVSMNNWFEIVSDDDEYYLDATSYDDAIKQLEKLGKEKQ